MRAIKQIIIHCSATPEGRNNTVEDLRRWHKEGNGWDDIGYHYVIHLDGSIHKGRPDEKQGAHCVGKNSTSIGVCYIGGVAKDGKTAKDTRTKEQKASLVRLLKHLRLRYPNAIIRGHRDYARKACPSFDAKSEYKDI